MKEKGNDIERQTGRKKERNSVKERAGVPLKSRRRNDEKKTS